MNKTHSYKAHIEWTGNKGSGTDHYQNYERSHNVKINGKVNLECSSDSPFRGDASKHNPEDFLLVSLSSCHMLWYLHLCADAGVIVCSYEDDPIGVMLQFENGSGKFSLVTLYPKVKVLNESMKQKAIDLHEKSHQYCFIANSVNFPVKHLPIVEIA